MKPHVYPNQLYWYSSCAMCGVIENPVDMTESQVTCRKTCDKTCNSIPPVNTHLHIHGKHSLHDTDNSGDQQIHILLMGSAISAPSFFSPEGTCKDWHYSSEDQHFSAKLSTYARYLPKVRAEPFWINPIAEHSWYVPL